MQQKTSQPVQFEITPPTRDAVGEWIKQAKLSTDDYLFPSRLHESPHLGTRQYERILDSWIEEIGLDPTAYGTSAPPLAPALPPAFLQPVLPLPQTGDGTATFVNGVAPLTIKTSSADGAHYFVKIVSVGSNLELGSYFIRSGQTLTIEVPLGIHELRYVSGRQWYGTYYLFGPDTNYSEAESLFEFTFDGYQFNGYTVELITQRNGNLRTSKIQPNQWWHSSLVVGIFILSPKHPFAAHV